MGKNRLINNVNDAQSANLREISMGNIAPHVLFRSSHPIKERKQEKAIASLAANARVASVINLSDTESSLNAKVSLSPWYNNLFKDSRVIALGMDFDFTSGFFNVKLKQAMQFIIKTEGPWLIHCHAGVDRTGFVSMVLESLMGASIDDISRDYLESFSSSYDSSIYTGADNDGSLMVMQLLSVMGGPEINDQNLQGIAENYLMRAIGLTAEEIAQLKKKLSGDGMP